MLKRQMAQEMTKKALDIQTISTKRTDFQLLLVQVTESKDTATPSQYQKSATFANPPLTSI